MAELVPHAGGSVNFPSGFGLTKPGPRRNGNRTSVYREIRFAARGRRLGVKRMVIGCLILVVMAAGLVPLGYRALREYGRTPAGSGPERIVEIPPGRDSRAVATLLAEEGIVRDALQFRILARLHGADRRIKAGEYLLSPALSPVEILDILTSGRAMLHRLTIPEGLTIRQIAGLVAQAGLGDAARFESLAMNPETARTSGIDAGHSAGLEGYLFPETYHFPKSTSEASMIRVMTAEFHKVFGKEWKQRAAELGLSVHQAVTLASIIEKETGAAVERPLIASVFYNRLRRKMRLQSDPTVIYGIPDFDGNLTRKHLDTPTPYNTYQIDGLPPGPIASPGRDSLRAALWPADTRYLYFVGRGDGTHQFSETLGEHNQAVRRYQLRP